MGLLDRLPLRGVQRHHEGLRRERHGLLGPRLRDEARLDLRVGDLGAAEEALQNVVVALLELEDAFLDDVLEEAQPAVLLDVEVEP